MKNADKKLVAGLVAVIIVGSIVGYAIGTVLPTVGDLDTPANTSISEYYIANSAEETGAENIVTAVLADYRGFDTLFETCVLFLAGVSVVLVLTNKTEEEKRTKTREDYLISYNANSNFSSALVYVAFRILTPIILIYAAYVLFHGEISLGGGFQAGALVGTVYLIDRIIPRPDRVMRNVSIHLCLIIAGLGTFIYALTGIIPLFNGGNFLEYDMLPFGGSIAELNADGILMIEIGVAICVAATIIAILEAVLERTRFDD